MTNTSPGCITVSAQPGSSSTVPSERCTQLRPTALARRPESHKAERIDDRRQCQLASSPETALGALPRGHRCSGRRCREEWKSARAARESATRGPRGRKAGCWSCASARSRALEALARTRFTGDGLVVLISFIAENEVVHGALRAGHHTEHPVERIGDITARSPHCPPPPLRDNAG